MSKRKNCNEKYIDESVKLSDKEISKFGHMSYINHHYKCFDSCDNTKNTLNIVDDYPKTYDCGCTVAIYDNYVGDEYCRNVYSGTRIIKNKIIKVKNCETHLAIVNRRKELLKELEEIENTNFDLIPRVIRTLNKHFYAEMSVTLSEKDVITQTVELL